MVQEMFLRKIPEDMRPWECNVNGVKYVYPAGTEQNVPAEVAALIDAYWEKQEVDYPETGISFNDLRDRPFGESTEVLFDQRVEFQDMGEGMMGYYGEFTEEIAPGVYTVTYNGAVYKCEAFATYDGGPADSIGNKMVFSGEDTGEPFFLNVGVDDGPIIMVSILCLDGSPSATIKIEKSVIHTIDPKFLPDGYPYEETVIGELQPETSVTVVSLGSSGRYATNPFQVPLEVGKTYTVVFNGVTYECVCEIDVWWGGPGIGLNDSYGSCFGNTSNSLPFTYAWDRTGKKTYLSSSVGTHTISITGPLTKLQTIDPKFLPGGGGGGVVVNITVDEETAVFVADKTHDEVKNAIANGKDVRFVYTKTNGAIEFLYLASLSYSGLICMYNPYTNERWLWDNESGDIYIDGGDV